MCRFLAYLGPPVSLSALLLDPPHSLLRQSWTPRMQKHGVVNADGFGIGWYMPAVRPEPVLYRSDKPMWTDRNLASLAGVVSSGAVLAAVRSATPPSPTEEADSPPFASGKWLFAHNGAVGVALGPLRRALSDVRLGSLTGATDSEVLFGLVLDRMDDGLEPGAALASVVEFVGEGRLNLVLTDGVSATAIAYGESLFTRSGTGVVLASEPFDDADDWVRVPERSVVRATAESLDVLDVEAV